MALLYRNRILFNLRKNYSKFVADLDLKECYSILGISEDSDQETIRSAYIDLVKKYHPDSGHPSANIEKFQQIDKAFRVLLTQKSRERWGSDVVNFEVHAQVFDINHTAPQHRQYLNYEGIGTGTPFQREKQYGKVRAMQAAENIMNHRVNKAQAEVNAVLDKKPIKHNIKTKYGFDRLVEDLIQESMSKGEFDNLSGKGKPLKGSENINPYVDFTTHKLNQVLIENGFTPEWIMLQKEIRQEKIILVNSFYLNRQQVGSYPFKDADKSKWLKMLENHKKMAVEINKKIEKYNLVVPILQKQMLQINFEKIAENVAKVGKSNEGLKSADLKQSNKAQTNKSIFSFLESFFIK